MSPLQESRNKYLIGAIADVKAAAARFKKLSILIAIGWAVIVTLFYFNIIKIEFGKLVEYIGAVVGFVPGVALQGVGASQGPKIRKLEYLLDRNAQTEDIPNFDEAIVGGAIDQK